MHSKKINGEVPYLLTIFVDNTKVCLEEAKSY